jgi:pyruvate dehydrogenase complex dehydrogenase (E1) component
MENKNQKFPEPPVRNVRTTPYINTIPANQQPPYPGRREIERRIKSIIRWNAMAMVVRANREESGIGGHISTYASAATLFEVGFNHFFRAKNEQQPGDIIYFQGHASPGIYARAFLEGRLSGFDLENFRRELKSEGGLPSYPHPRLMPDFWQFPTVSMGLSPIMAIYQARFNRYLENRHLKEPSDQNIWVFLGDGEMDEPESLGAISLAGRDRLDNLIFVINCNLQRLDGPVRGNGKIIQELESVFAGAGWNVIKVIWGSDWDPLLEKDRTGILVKRMEETLDGHYQKYVVSSGDYIRKNFFAADPRLLELVKNYSDEQLEKLNRGGHDPVKVYAAYKAAVEHKGSPTVILAQTIKGYGLGEAGEGLQHQDGHSHHFAYSVPNLKAYDPAFAYELAVIVRDGIYRMYEKQENIFYYITIMNEFYQMPPMPDGVKDGILKGMYRYKTSSKENSGAKAVLLGSGAILNEALKAQKILESQYGISVDVWSVTSYKELYMDGLQTERQNMLHPAEKPNPCYIQRCFENQDAVFVAASDYLKALPCSIAKWMPGRMVALGTDGFGRSDSRASLRDYFEVDARFITLAALQALALEKKVDPAVAAGAIKDLNIDSEKINPVDI